MKCHETVLYGFLPAALLTIATACSSPVAPAGSVTVTTASLVAPANGAQIANAAQPVTLTINNAVVTGADAAVTYTFEVATDAGFVSKVVTKDVPQGPGQTSLKLDPLPPGKDYYWRVRTTAKTVGSFSDPIKFTIGPALVLNAPVPLSPASGATRIIWPTFTVANAIRLAPVGPVLYRFDISTSSAFNAVLITGTVPEGSMQTSFTPPSSQPAPTQTTQYFWRATVIDQTNATLSESTTAQTFTFEPPTSAAAKLAAQEGVELWPGQRPTGTTGQSKLGDNWGVQTLVAFGGTPFTSPLIECLRVFDLMDRGFDPSGAIDWMHAHGYPVAGAYYPVAFGVVGFDFVYLAFNPVTRAWDMILRGE